MVIFQDFQFSIFGNDGEALENRGRTISEASENRRRRKIGDARNEKMEMSQNPRFHTTATDYKFETLTNDLISDMKENSVGKGENASYQHFFTRFNCVYESFTCLAHC